MKRVLFIIVFVLGELNSPLLANAQRTGITDVMIATGQNIYVNNSKAAPQMKIITGIDPASAAPVTPVCSSSPLIKTGATVYRWYATQKKGVYKNYKDAFCLTQGCSHQGALKANSKCATKP